MKRTDALAWIRIAGYHGDQARATRLMLQSRVSFKAYQDAYAEGAKQKRGGMQCNCCRCKRTDAMPETRQPIT